MQETDIGFLHFAFQTVFIVLEFVAQLFHHITGAADTAGPVVAMLGHFLPGACYDETAQGRNIERVLAITAGAHDIDGLMPVEINRHTELQQCIAKALQLFDGDTAHKVYRHEGSYLVLIVKPLANTHQRFFGGSPAKGFMCE